MYLFNPSLSFSRTIFQNSMSWVVLLIALCLLIRNRIKGPSGFPRPRDFFFNISSPAKGIVDYWLPRRLIIKRIDSINDRKGLRTTRAVRGAADSSLILIKARVKFAQTQMRPTQILNAQVTSIFLYFWNKVQKLKPVLEV